MSHFPSEEFLSLGDELSQRDDQASVRTAISRAYYGVFLLARSVASIQSKHSDVHRSTQAYFYGNGAYPIADVLKAMRKLRNEADYNERLTFPQEAAESTVAMARQVHQELRQLRTPHLSLHTRP